MGEGFGQGVAARQWTATTGTAARAAAAGVAGRSARSLDPVTAGLPPTPREHAGTPWRRASRSPGVAHLDPRALAGAGVPLTLLMDLVDPAGPDSVAIYWGEPTVGDDTWLG